MSETIELMAERLNRDLKVYAIFKIQSRVVDHQKKDSIAKELLRQLGPAKNDLAVNILSSEKVVCEWLESLLIETSLTISKIRHLAARRKRGGTTLISPYLRKKHSKPEHVLLKPAAIPSREIIYPLRSSPPNRPPL